MIEFRSDWGHAWTRLESTPELFVYEFKQKRDNGDRVVWVRGEALPATLVDYMRGPAKSLLDNEDLPAYISSAQMGLGAATEIILGQVIADDLLRYTEKIDDTSTTGREGLSRSLDERLEALQRVMTDAGWPDANPDENPIDRWRNGFRAEVDRLDGDLRRIRRGERLQSG